MSLGIWSEFSPGTFWIAEETNFRHADNKESDQSALMRSLSAHGTFFDVSAHFLQDVIENNNKKKMYK